MTTRNDIWSIVIVMTDGSRDRIDGLTYHDLLMIATYQLANTREKILEISIFPSCNPPGSGVK